MQGFVYINDEYNKFYYKQKINRNQKFDLIIEKTLMTKNDEPLNIFIATFIQILAIKKKILYEQNIISFNVLYLSKHNIFLRIFKFHLKTIPRNVLNNKKRLRKLKYVVSKKRHI